MLKKELRFKYKELRNQLSENDIEDKSLAIVNHILPLSIWDKTYYHTFLSITSLKEINTEYLLHLLAGKDKEIVVSKCDLSSTNMTHYLLTDNTALNVNKYNIPEPVNGLEVPAAKIEVVFIPLLAFDKKGNRVGYGKGYYDVFLSECKPDVLKIGLSFFEAEEVITDAYANDIPLDYCVTPNGVYKFNYY
ncbi:MAG TPA: 5-formyltetrahydrofolate cyclo-ligase [Flavobacterium sp.]|nr:5-formyltetrahydrofolate cyclo-ligase [Flavobacterium sp.]